MHAWHLCTCGCDTYLTYGTPVPSALVAVLVSTVWARLTADILSGDDVHEAVVSNYLSEACEHEVRALRACVL